MKIKLIDSIKGIYSFHNFDYQDGKDHSSKEKLRFLSISNIGEKALILISWR